MTGERVFRVTEAVEDRGFARCVAEDIEEAVLTELYIPDAESGGLVRMRVGDRIAGTLKGRYVVEVRFVEKVAPPVDLVASIASFAAEHEAHGLSFPGPFEPYAERIWRFDQRHPTKADVIVNRVIVSQLTFLFSKDHPLEDPALPARFSLAMRKQGVDMDVAERRDENEDLLGFQVLPGDHFIALGASGDWDDPNGCFTPLVDYANEALGAHGTNVRWMEQSYDWVLAEPALYDFVRTHAFVNPLREVVTPAKEIVAPASADASAVPSGGGLRSLWARMFGKRR